MHQYSAWGWSPPQQQPVQFVPVFPPQPPQSEVHFPPRNPKELRKYNKEMRKLFKEEAEEEKKKKDSEKKPEKKGITFAQAMLVLTIGWPLIVVIYSAAIVGSIKGVSLLFSLLTH